MTKPTENFDKLSDVQQEWLKKLKVYVWIHASDVPNENITKGLIRRELAERVHEDGSIDNTWGNRLRLTPLGNQVTPFPTLAWMEREKTDCLSEKCSGEFEIKKGTQRVERATRRLGLLEQTKAILGS